jgi:hypothetical protein
MSAIDELFELCKAAMIEKGFIFHELPKKAMLYGKHPMKGCAAKYRPRSNKTMIVYYNGEMALILYAIKKKLFISPIDIPPHRHVGKNAIKHRYHEGAEYNWR